MLQTSPVLTLTLVSTNETGLQYYGRETMTALSTDVGVGVGYQVRRKRPGFPCLQLRIERFQENKRNKTSL